MKAGIGTAELVEAFSTRSVTEVYDGPVVLTDLRETLKTEGHLIVLRGDLVPHIHNPKGWVYESITMSARIQDAMRDYPDYALFDGVGLSGMEAACFYAQSLGRKLVVVISREFPHSQLTRLLDTYGERVQVVLADEPLERGYVRKQADILRTRTDLIYLNNALYAVKAMAPVGNRVVHELEKLGV